MPEMVFGLPSGGRRLIQGSTGYFARWWPDSGQREATYRRLGRRAAVRHVHDQE
jgi:hypothetical protein